MYYYNTSVCEGGHTRGRVVVIASLHVRVHADGGCMHGEREVVVVMSCVCVHRKREVVVTSVHVGGHAWMVVTCMHVCHRGCHWLWLCPRHPIFSHILSPLIINEDCMAALAAHTVLSLSSVPHPCPRHHVPILIMFLSSLCFHPHCVSVLIMFLSLSCLCPHCHVIVGVHLWDSGGSWW